MPLRHDHERGPLDSDRGIWRFEQLERFQQLFWQLMRREVRDPRPDSREKVEKLGLAFHTLNGQPYWYESAAYVFDKREVDELEAATAELQRLCMAAIDHVLENGDLDRLSIPASAQSAIRKAWDDDPPAVYGRFDLSFDGSGPPKMLEYNADTPTSLLEAAVVQWHWLQDVAPEADQFNSIWEALVQKWTALKSEGFFASGTVHFACVDWPEDVMTTAVLMDTADEAGLTVRQLGMGEIGWDTLSGRFVGTEGEPIECLFKLYPWENMVTEPFGTHALSPGCKTLWIEPVWKMVVSNKAILALLWELFPDHPNLLPAYLDGPRELVDYARKPILGREGANVSLCAGGVETATDGDYAHQPTVWQALAPLPVFDGNHAVIGSWVVDGEPCGMGVRESDGPVTQDAARFVPHWIQ